MCTNLINTPSQLKEAVQHMDGTVHDLLYAGSRLYSEVVNLWDLRNFLSTKFQITYVFQGGMVRPRLFFTRQKAVN